MSRLNALRTLSLLASTAVGLVLASGVAAGHVRYVTTREEAGDGLAFLASALTEPLNLLALGAGGIGVAVAIVAYLRVRAFDRDVAAFREVMMSYSDLLPWLLRLGFGLPLIGAGFAGYFFNPVVDPLVGGGVDRLLQILLGFMIIFGLGTRIASIVGLGAYLLALPAAPLLAFSIEWVPGLIALALLGSGRPSADHTLQQVAATRGTFYNDIDPIHGPAAWFNDRYEPYERYVPTAIRLGLGVAFVFLGLFEKLLAPTMALDVVERYGLSTVTPVPPDLWVLGAGFSELALGIAIAVGFFTRASAMTALFVFTLTLFALPDDPVLAHIGLFSLASALLITGGGPYSIDRRLADPRREPDRSADETHPATSPADD